MSHKSNLLAILIAPLLFSITPQAAMPRDVTAYEGTAYAVTRGGAWHKTRSNTPTNGIIRTWLSADGLFDYYKTCTSYSAQPGGDHFNGFIGAVYSAQDMGGAETSGVPRRATGSIQLEAPSPKPIVGAIRWDAWTEWGYFQQFLQPKEWHDRLPFFAKSLQNGSVEVRCDSQDVMEKEIAYAKQAGLDYWAFDWYHPGSKPAKNFMTRCLELYLASPHRADINYCLVLLAGGDGTNGDFHLGSKEEWPATTDYLVQRFSDANYQKVLGNRPLAYFFETENWMPLWGSRDAVQGAWKLLADKCVAKGLGKPYIAVLVFDPATGERLLDEHGLDAISAYANPGANDNREQPYTALAAQNRWFWDACVPTGRKFIPTVNAGWDYRPEKNHGFSWRNPEADWFTPPTPEELANHLKSAVEWVRTHPGSCDANAVLIYAWNELNEGGWLVPTLKEGTARVEALRGVLRPEMDN